MKKPTHELDRVKGVFLNKKKYLCLNAVALGTKSTVYYAKLPR